MEREGGERCRTGGGGRSEIDTRAPFRSVREAVALFGEKVLAGEIYANKIKEIPTDVATSPSPRSRVGNLASELEQTKQTLAKTLEQNSVLSQLMKTLTHELQEARREIQRLKTAQEPAFNEKSRMENPEIEELKFVEQHRVINTGRREYGREADEEDEKAEEFEKRRLVKFASPPRLTRVMSSAEEEKKVLERPPSVKKTKKKAFNVPFMVRFFARKKGHDVEDDQSPIHGH